jgi:hypothetical protein
MCKWFIDKIISLSLTLHPLFPIIIITHINTFKQSVKTFTILFTKVSIRILFGQETIADPAEIGSTLHTSHLVTPIYLLKIKNMKLLIVCLFDGV